MVKMTCVWYVSRVDGESDMCLVYQEVRSKGFNLMTLLVDNFLCNGTSKE